jgi:hypothetical protein
LKLLAFHAWPEEERAIPRRLLLTPRFAGGIRTAPAATRSRIGASPKASTMACGSRRRGQGVRLIIATDNDAGGRALDDQLNALVRDGQGLLFVS